MSVPVYDRPSVAGQTEAQNRAYGDKDRYNSLENGGSRYANSPLLDLPIRQLLWAIAVWAQSKQRATCPPRDAVRQLSMALMTFNWPRLI
jgi:hypothetical protein